MALHVAALLADMAGKHHASVMLPAACACPTLLVWNRAVYRLDEAADRPPGFSLVYRQVFALWLPTAGR